MLVDFLEEKKWFIGNYRDIDEEDEYGELKYINHIRVDLVNKTYTAGISHSSIRIG